MAQNHWLMKTEPDVFSVDDLKRQGRTWWDGVRNYQARNFMMKDMKVGDPVLIYHSNAEPPGVAGLAAVSKSAQPDRTALDPKSDYHDPKATAENPRWFCVEVEYRSHLPRFVPLDELRQIKALKDMMLLRPGSRLSITPVTEAEFREILNLAKAKK